MKKTLERKLLLSSPSLPVGCAAVSGSSKERQFWLNVRFGLLTRLPSRLA